MIIGVPKEIKVHEYRVGLTPASVAELVAHGHEVFVETKAGTGGVPAAYRIGDAGDPIDAIIAPPTAIAAPPASIVRSSGWRKAARCSASLR